MRLEEYLKLNFLSAGDFGKAHGISRSTMQRILKRQTKSLHPRIIKKVYIGSEKNVNLSDPLDY